MASGTRDWARRMQPITAEHPGETTTEPHVRDPASMDTNTGYSTPHSLPVQAAEGSKSATQEIRDLAQVNSLEATSPIFPYEHSLTSPSDHRIQLPTRSQASPRLNAPSTEFTQQRLFNADGRSPSSSPFTPFSPSPAPHNQVRSSSPLQQSFEPCYSSPKVSAVSSSMPLPVMPPFQRPSRPRPELLDDAVSSLKGTKERKHDDLSQIQDRNMTLSSLENDDCVDPGISDYGEGVVAHEYVPLEDRNLRKVAYTPTRKNIVPAREYKGQQEAAAIKGNQINQLDDANKSPPVTDDASDVMNPLIDGGEGLVIPRIKGVQSMDPEELNDLMEAMFESDVSPDHPATPPFFRRSSSSTSRPRSRFASSDASCFPISAHVQFAANPSVQDTPFAKTLNYFKQFKDKENSPSKSRRNASLPEEIAELAKEAQQEGVEDEKAVWDKYREIDLAPMDPIIDDGSDVDSIMGTPVRKTTDVAENSETDDRTRAVSIRPKTRDLPGDGKSNEQASAPLGLNAKVIEGYANETGPMYLVDIPGHFGDAFHLRFRTRASVELITVFLRKRGEALDASKDDIDRLVESFRECPGRFKIRDPSGPASSSSENGDCDQTPDDHAHEKQMILYQEDPVFVKIIGMLPEAAFWVVAQPIAHYSGRFLDAASKTFDAALQELTGLSLDETPASE